MPKLSTQKLAIAHGSNPQSEPDPPTTFTEVLKRNVIMGFFDYPGLGGAKPILGQSCELSVMMFCQGLTRGKITDAIAITAPGRTPLTYRRLRDVIEDIRVKLNGMGIGRNDRVAIALSNGPEMAVAFLAIASTATCAPLNPRAISC